MRYLCQPPRALARLHRHRTYYEAALCGPDKRPVAALAYDQKRTKRALLMAVYNHGPDIASMAGVDANDCAVTWNGTGWAIGDSGYVVAWSGFTEYERASEATLRAAA